MKIVINEYIDLVWKNERPVLFVAGKEFQRCAFLAVTIPAEKVGSVRGDNVIDSMTSFEGAKSLHGVVDVDDYLHRVGGLSPEEHITPETIMQAHASNLQAWVENGYNTEILESNLSFPLLKELARVGDEKARRVLQGEIIRRLSVDFEPTSEVIVSTCLDVMDEEAIEVALRSKYPQVRYVAIGEVRSPDILSALARDKDLRVRIIAATNDNTPPSTLAIMADDKYRNVRLRIAHRRDTPPDSLAKLASDIDEEVRAVVASNASTPLDALIALAGGSDCGIVIGVGTNAVSTLKAIIDAGSDEDRHIVIDLLRERIKNGDSNARIRMIKRGLDRYFDTETLSILSRDPDPNVREAVIESNRVTPEALYMFSNDDDRWIRRAIAHDLKTPLETLRELSMDDDEVVRGAANQTIYELNEKGIINYKET